MVQQDDIRGGRARQRAIRMAIGALVWISLAILYYAFISLVSDTPSEHELRHSTDRLEAEYKTLVERYDSLSSILDNIAERDRNVFRKLFESNPYDLNADDQQRRIELHERLLASDNCTLAEELSSRLSQGEATLRRLERAHEDVERSTAALGAGCDLTISCPRARPYSLRPTAESRRSRRRTRHTARP